MLRTPLSTLTLSDALGVSRDRADSVPVGRLTLHITSDHTSDALAACRDRDGSVHVWLIRRLHPALCLRFLRPTLLPYASPISPTDPARCPVRSCCLTCTYELSGVDLGLSMILGDVRY
eukprot:3941128-Rhodomonas_salina.10